jgi:DNA-binding response OmpR family regulator
MTQGHILIVDDDEILSGLLQLTLELEGYTVETAANGEIGLDKMRATHFDLVLLDLVMPRVDGIKFLRLRHDEGGPMPPVIIISSTSGEEVSGLPAEMGVLGFLRKPVEPTRLVEQVGKALAGEPLDCA